MEMSQMYDENILDNKFFQKFCDLCPALFQSAIEQEWLVSYTLFALMCHVIVNAIKVVLISSIYPIHIQIILILSNLGTYS